MSSPGKNDQAAPAIDEPIRSIRIFTYPKVIFLWPTLVTGLICGIGMLLVGDLMPEAEIEEQAALHAHEHPAAATVVDTKQADGTVEATPKSDKNYFSSWQNMLGLMFLLVFAANMIVMSLDFPRFTIVAGILLVTTLMFMALWLAPKFDFLAPLVWLSRHIYAVANAGFYFTIATILGLMFLLIASTRYLDYWEISPNEILHHHGPLSDLERFPTINLKFSKEIPDILEYILGLGSGRLTMSFGLDNRAVTLEHVLFIGKKEEMLKRMMSELDVRIDKS